MSFTRSALLAAVVAALLAVAALGVFTFAVRHEPPPEELAAPALPVAPAAATPTAEAVVADLEGLVERSSGQGWVPVAVGDNLPSDASLRVGPGARAEVDLGGDDSRVTVWENSEIKMLELSQALHQLRLSSGRIAVAYEARGERVLRVEDPTGKIVAQTKEGRVSMVSSGTVFAVATQTGTVNLAAAGVAIDVGAGFQSVVVEGAPPSRPAPIPIDVLLKVANAAGGHADLCAILRGTVRPGAQLLIDGVKVEPDAAGLFETRVPAAPGKRAAVVMVKEPGGAVKTRTLACRASPAKTEVQFDWGGQ